MNYSQQTNYVKNLVVFISFKVISNFFFYSRIKFFLPHYFLVLQLTQLFSLLGAIHIEHYQLIYIDNFGSPPFTISYIIISQYSFPLDDYK